MKTIIVITLLITSVNITAQKNAVVDTTAHPAITEAGKPNGKIAEMMMNKDGGTLISGDGNLELIIPSGALSKKTSISIQPVTNMVPNGNGQAYRLEPSGIEFQKPVQLVFHYTPEESADSMQLLMGIAMQDNTGQWYSLKKFTLDTVAKTIGGNINHFSDWSKFDNLKITPPSARLKVNKNRDLDITLISSPDDLNNELMSLPPMKTTTITWKAAWSATAGKIKVNSQTEIEYTAPASVPDQNPVHVSAKLQGLKSTYNGITFYNPRLVSRILIYDNAYEVTMTSSINSPAGGDMGMVTYKDTGSFVVSITGKEAKIIERVNKNSPDKLDYKGKCDKPELLKQGSGNIHIAGVQSIKLIPSKSPGEPAQVEIFFKRTPTILPIFKFKCPKSPFFNNAAGNAMIAMVAPAYPQHIEFFLLEGTQIEHIGQEGSDAFVMYTIRQVKDDE